MALLNIASQESIIAILAIDHGLIDHKEAADLVARCRQEGTEPLTELFMAHRGLRDQLLRAAAEELGYPYFDMANSGAALKMDPSLLEDVDLDALERYSAMPMTSNDAGTIVVVIADPTDPNAKAFLTKQYEERRGFKISYAVASPFHIRRELTSLRTRLQSEAISREAAAADREDSELRAVLAQAEDDSAESSPVVKFVSSLLSTAAFRRASDVHLNPNPDGTYEALYRVDGVLQRPEAAVPRGRELEVIAQIMVRASMDPSNMRFPQDGRLKFPVAGRSVDGRVAMVPQVSGPKITVRLLDSATLDLSLEDMGLSEHALGVLRESASKRQGLIVVSGPTGSGKTTTNYAMLREIQSIEKNIMTVEDPVEYQIQGLNQIQVARAAHQGLTFETALRSMMRSDPDVIFVGEIRDTPTAKIAADASITGHLVLATIHASSAVEVFTRFIEMGVPPYVIAEALSVATAQRLIRRVCTCAKQEEPTLDEVRALERMKLPVPPIVMHPRGCGICNGVGYMGRMASTEVLEVTGEIRSLITDRAATHTIREAAARSGFIPLVEDGFRHVVEQRTTITEFLRAIL